MSNTGVAFGGIDGLPRSPYARSGGMTRVRFPPTFSVATPSSHPLITPPVRLNVNGRPRSTELSNPIVLTGDVRISPVIVSQAGMTITVANALPDGTVPLAATTQQRFVGVEAGAKAGAKVGELLEALNRLDVPFEKRVSILEEIHRAGKLHAPILYER